MQKAGKLFHDSLDQAIGCDDELKHKTLHSSGEKKLYSLVKPIGVEAMHKAIDIEMAVKENYPHKTVFFRGYGEGIDFNAEDSFYVAKKHSESDYAKTMAGENPSGRKFNKNHRFAVSMRKGAALPSFGAKLLSGLWSNGSDCSLEYIAKSKRGFAIPVSKKELMEESNAIFCIGNDLDSSTAKYRSIGKSGIFFHPRGKAHLSEEKPEIEMQYENLELSWRQPKADHEYFVRDSPRAVIYPTQQEARQGYVDYHEYTLNNAIPLTEPTAKDLKKAKKRGIVE
ncbi:hypothetical protein IPH67_03935 [bacterium]|nr:MAG: hypothetical protein IPH67_03935 [bacterium]